MRVKEAWLVYITHHAIMIIIHHHLHRPSCIYPYSFQIGPSSQAPHTLHLTTNTEHDLKQEFLASIINTYLELLWFIIWCWSPSCWIYPNFRCLETFYSLLISHIWPVHKGKSNSTVTAHRPLGTKKIMDDEDEWMVWLSIQEWWQDKASNQLLLHHSSFSSSGWS